MITALIVDDEKDARNLLRMLLEYIDLDVSIIGEADSLESGVRLISRRQPDLVFLDIQLRGKTGFDLLAEFPDPNFEVIFITAYGEFESFAKGSGGLIDYLIKPIDEMLLKKAVLKAIKIIGLKYLERKIKFRQLPIPFNGGIRFIHVDSISWLESVPGKSKTVFHFNDQGSVVGNRGIGYFCNELKSFSFCRVHSSFAVNLNYVNEYRNANGGYLLMKNFDTPINLSNTYVEYFFELIQRYTPHTRGNTPLEDK